MSLNSHEEKKKKKIRLNEGYLSPFLSKSPQGQKTFVFELFGHWFLFFLGAFFIFIFR